MATTAELQLEAAQSALDAFTLTQQNLPAQRAIQDAQLKAQMASITARQAVATDQRALEDARIAQQTAELTQQISGLQAMVDSENAVPQPEPVQLVTP